MATLEKDILMPPSYSLIDWKLLVAAVKLQNQGKLENFACGINVQIGDLPLHSFQEKQFHESLKIPATLQDIEILKNTSENELLCSGSFMPVESRRDQATSSCNSALGDPNFASMISRHLKLPLDLINVRARVKHLVLHEYSGKCYVNNVCSCCIDGKFGTVLLQLPVEGGHKGGRLTVEYKGRKEVFDTHATSDKNIFISAFYDCCEHFTETVTEGYKLTVVYDLIWTNAKTSIPKEFPVFLTALKQIKEALQSWTRRYEHLQNSTDEESLSSYLDNSADSEIDEDSLEEKNVNNHSDYLYSDDKLRENILFFVLNEKYDVKTLSFKILRDQDQKMAELLLNCTFLDVHLAVVNRNIIEVDVRPLSQTEIKSETNEETATVTFSRLIDFNDVTRNLSLELNWNRQFVGLEPHQEKNAYNRNPEGKTEIGKISNDYCVLMIWPKHHSTQIFSRYGIMSRLPQNPITSSDWREEPPLSVAPKLRISIDNKNDLILPRWAPVSKLPPSTPPVGRTMPRIRITSESRFGGCDSASRTPRTGLISSTKSFGQDWSVWKGSLTYKDMVFKVIMDVLSCDKSTNFIKSVLPSSLEVIGSISDPDKVWNYLKRVKETNDEEVVFLQFTPATYPDWKLYLSFSQMFQEKGLAVLGGVKSPIKHLYLFPILQGSPVPTELMFLSSVLENRSSSLLLGIAIMYQRPQEIYSSPKPQKNIPRVAPIIINVNSNSTEHSAEIRTSRRSVSHERVAINVPLAVVDQDPVTVSIFGKSRMRNAMLKGLNRQTISNQILPKATKVTSTSPGIPVHGDLTEHLSSVIDSVSRRITQQRRTLLLSEEETNLLLPVSSIASSLPYSAKSKAKSSQTPPKRASCVSKPKVSQKRSAGSSNEDEIPSKVVKSNSGSIRTVSRTSLKEASPLLLHSSCCISTVSAELNDTAVRKISSTSSPSSLSNYDSPEAQPSSSSNKFLLNRLRESWGLNVGGGNENAIRLDNSDADVSESNKPENTTYLIDREAEFHQSSCNKEPSDCRCTFVSWIWALLPEAITSDRSGKWIFLSNKKNVNEIWQKVKNLLTDNQLGNGAKVTNGEANTHLISLYTYDFNDVRDVFRVLVTIRRNRLSGDYLFYKTNETPHQGLYTTDQATKIKHPVEQFSMYSTNYSRVADKDCVQMFLSKPDNKKELVAEKDLGGMDLEPVFYKSPQVVPPVDVCESVDGPRVRHDENKPKKTKRVTFNI